MCGCGCADVCRGLSQQQKWGCSIEGFCVQVPSGKTGIQGLTLGRVSESSAGGIHIVHVSRYFPNNEPPSYSARVRGISPLALRVIMRDVFVLVCAARCVCALCACVPTGNMLSLATGWTWGQVAKVSLPSGCWIWQQLMLNKSDICGGKG